MKIPLSKLLRFWPSYQSSARAAQILLPCKTPVSSARPVAPPAGGIASASGASAGQAVAIGAATGAVVAAVTYVIAKHQATERQHQIAEERAQRAYARMSAGTKKPNESAQDALHRGRYGEKQPDCRGSEGERE
jgi:hypothetical protein